MVGLMKPKTVAVAFQDDLCGIRKGKYPSNSEFFAQQRHQIGFSSFAETSTVEFCNVSFNLLYYETQ
jgi:hypothetical protein